MGRWSAGVGGAAWLWAVGVLAGFQAGMAFAMLTAGLPVSAFRWALLTATTLAGLTTLAAGWQGRQPPDAV